MANLPEDRLLVVIQYFELHPIILFSRYLAFCVPFIEDVHRILLRKPVFKLSMRAVSVAPISHARKT